MNSNFKSDGLIYIADRDALRGHSISITSKGDVIIALKDGRIEKLSKPSSKYHFTT